MDDANHYRLFEIQKFLDQLHQTGMYKNFLEFIHESRSKQDVHHFISDECVIFAGGIVVGTTWAKEYKIYFAPSLEFQKSLSCAFPVPIVGHNLFMTTYLRVRFKVPFEVTFKQVFLYRHHFFYNEEYCKMVKAKKTFRIPKCFPKRSASRHCKRCLLSAQRYNKR